MSKQFASLRGLRCGQAARRVRLDVSTLGLALVVLGLASPAAWAADQTWNVGPVLAPTKAKLAAGEQANIVILGDSLSFEGFSWASWVPDFRTLMQAYYGDGGYGYQSFSYLTGGYPESGRKLIGSGPNVDRAPFRAIDGQWVGLAEPGAATRFEAYSDEVELHYYVGPLGGAAVVYDGAGQVLATLQGEGPVSSAAAWRHTFTGDDRTLRIESVTEGAFSILGYNNLAPSPDAGGVRVHRASNSGWNTSNYARRDGSFDDQLELLDTDLVVIMIGQNEWSGGGIAFENRLSLMLQRIQAVGADVLLLGSYDSSRWYLPSVMDSQQKVAEAKGAGWVNLYSTAGSRSFWLANDYLHDDNLHFSPVGAAYLAEFVFEAFVSDGRSVYPWLLGDMNDDATFDEADIDPWVLALTQPAEYDAAYNRVWAQRSGDFNGDGLVNTQDINSFVARLGRTPSSTVVPEPSALGVMVVALAGLLRRHGAS